MKFIHNNDLFGSPPLSGVLGNSTGFAAELAKANAVLAATGRGYSLRVVEYVEIQPPAPVGQTSDYWFSLPARSNRQTIENAALAAKAVWAWNDGAINFYVNNSTSGQCSFVGTGSSISMGSNASTGTVLHETGHVFNLKHTHAGDYTTDTNPPTEDPVRAFAISDLTDGDALTATLNDNLAGGDGLTETVNDNPNISSHDQLCNAIFGHNYNVATAAQQAIVDSSYENVMSYHNENRLLSVQMDIWTQNANGARNGFCNGRTWFLANGGNDGANGVTASTPLASVASGISHVSSANDVVLLRNGTYSATAGVTITKPCTLRATRGDITIQSP